MSDTFEKLAYSVTTAVRCGQGRDKIYAAIRDGTLLARKVDSKRSSPLKR